MRDHDERPDKSAGLFERRDVLGLLGAGSVLLAAPRLAGATTDVAAASGPCTGMPGCPSAMPPVPAKPAVDKLPGLIKLATTLPLDLIAELKPGDFSEHVSSAQAAAREAVILEK